MILTRLVELYERRPDLPRPGFQEKEISFIVELAPDGTPTAVIDTREGDGKKLRGRRFLVPQEVKRTSGERANLLWDTPEYALGVPKPDKRTGRDDGDLLDATSPAEAERAVRRQALFAAEVERFAAESPGDEGLAALRRFLGRDGAGALRGVATDGQWAALCEGACNVGFRLQGDTDLVSGRPAVREAVASRAGSTGVPEGQCLVTGRRGAVARLHPSIKGVYGAQTSGANVVSFNFAAVESHGLTQGANAPVGDYAAFAYTTALNALLARDSRNKMRAGTVTVVFWAGAETPNEGPLLDIFGLVAESVSPREVDPVRALYDSPKSGQLPILGDPTPFFILGLSAESKSRLTVRFFRDGTVGAAARALARYFDDLEIAGAEGRPRLFHLLCALAVQGKAENIPPLLGAEFLRAAFTGGRFPERLLAEAINRCAAESGPTADRARLIKAFLIRNRNQEVAMSLDPANPDPAYRMGRLFAALESLQQAAIAPNATIRDRFYGAASTTPGHVFPELERLAMSHIGKLQGDRPGLAVWFEKRLAGIHAGLAPRFPARLSLEEQGAFAIGYWHERAERGAKADEPAPESTDTTGQ